MRIGNLAGRLAILTGKPGHETSLDVEAASGGRFGPDPQAIYDDWPEFRSWVNDLAPADGVPIEPKRLGPPVACPRQILAIGLNYREHAQESGYAAPRAEPPVFTKFVSCITGPYCDIALPTYGQTDWEVKLVAVIGRCAERVSVERALSYVAGFSVGQDISERRLQMVATPPQFSLGKSFRGFGPIVPWLVTLDEFPDPNDLELSCTINGEQRQVGRTSEMIFSVPALISHLSQYIRLLPGDVIFTGTPPGVGLGWKPPVWLAEGDIMESRIEGIGLMRHRFVSPQSH